MIVAEKILPSRGRWQAKPDGEGPFEMSRDSGCALSRTSLQGPLHRFAVPLPRGVRIS